MAEPGILPHLTASLNGLALVLVMLGFVLIRSGRRDLHRVAMAGALIASALFLAAYIAHHVTTPIFVFRGTGWLRSAYYTLLVSHVVLAAITAPLIAITAWRALTRRFERHRRLARLTLPLWLYVSASGVAVYVLLYHVTA